MPTGKDVSSKLKGSLNIGRPKPKHSWQEQERLSDFVTALGNVTPGPKAEELKSHLEKLISQCEVKIKHKEEKIQDIHSQLQNMDGKNKPAETMKDDPPPVEE